MIYYPPIVRTGLTQKRVACIYGFLRFFFFVGWECGVLSHGIATSFGCRASPRLASDGIILAKVLSAVFKL